jgi:glycosyltransferase involved in cell wall biosynthesis
MQTRAFIISFKRGDFYRVGRTLRSLAAAGVEAEEIRDFAPAKLSGILREGGPVWFVRAGAWLVRCGGFGFPRPSATGRGLCAVGAVRTASAPGSARSELAPGWKDFFARTGGNSSSVDGSSGEQAEVTLPELASLYLDAAGVSTLAAADELDLREILRRAQRLFRLVHFAPLDVYEDPGLRVVQVITSLQRGGAERLTLDLAAALPARNVSLQLATIGRPAREPFPSPPRTIDLGQAAPTLEARCARLARLATAFGADLVHGHLLSAEDARCISARGLPLLMTVHNTRSGWPSGLSDLRDGDATLLAACCQAVNRDLRDARLPTAIRTVRNGVDLRQFRETAERKAMGQKWRQTWGFGETNLVLVAVANPRPQKRLHLLPGVLVALRAKLPPGREARMVFCGEASAAADAQQSLNQIRAAVIGLGLDEHVRWTGPVDDVAGLLAAADIFVSASAHEGLSLAQLEALSMGCSVVATEAGGELEIARDNPRMRVLPRDASVEMFAETILECAKRDTLEQAAAPQTPLNADWSSDQTAGRYRWLYPRVIVSSRHRGSSRGVWLIANNFSTGGAQSSARRLLTGLAFDGTPVRAAVIEEDPDNPTPGRKALAQAGIPVLAIPPERSERIPTAVEQLLAAIDNDPPQAVVFWNLRPAYKLLLADALVNVPVFDVSPGEMFFESLEAYFERPRPDLPYRTPREYGALLRGVIVKYRAEAARAAEILGATVHVVPNGVPFPELAVERACRSDRFVFGTAARISPRKRLEDLLMAFREAHGRLPPCVLKIAGGVEFGADEYAGQLRQLAKGLPVEWLGEISDLSAFHRELDAFLMISEPAGCPNASLEAMAAGLPVIATDLGGASEQVIHDETGLLVPARDPNAFATAMIQLASDRSMREKMGSAARARISKHFSLPRMIDAYRAVLLPS